MEIVDGIKQALDYTKNKNYKKAEKIYLSLLRKYPNNASVMTFLGLLYYNVKVYLKSEKYLEKAYKITHSNELLFYIGMSKFYLTKYISAVPYMELALKEKSSLELYQSIIKSCRYSSFYKKGYDYAKEAYAKYPFDVNILEQLSFLALECGLFKEAESYAYKALQFNPKSVMSLQNLGLINEILYRNEEAARDCYKLMVKYGDKIKGYSNLAISYGKDKRTKKKAYYYLKKLQTLEEDVVGFNFALASYYLTNRQFKKGYRYYVNPDFDTKEQEEGFLKYKNRWLGEKGCEDKTIFVYGDQGIGDQLQFIRYLPYLSKRFKKVKVMVHKSLISLFKLSYKEYKNITFYELSTKILRYDKSTFLSFLPYYLNMNFSHIPYSKGYIKYNNKLTDEYSRNYFNNNKYKIGICWEVGATGLRKQIQRLLNIEMFEDIINMDSASVYSFQVNPSLDNYKKYPKLYDLGSTFKDFSYTAAALKNLDVMVTVDTSVAHLSGALGVKTILLLPYCTDWRWFYDEETTAWYDSIKIFKQKQCESWENVFERVQNYLNNSI